MNYVFIAIDPALLEDDKSAVLSVWNDEDGLKIINKDYMKSSKYLNDYIIKLCKKYPAKNNISKLVTKNNAVK